MKSTTQYFIDELKKAMKEISKQLEDYHEPENKLDAKELFYTMLSFKLSEQQAILRDNEKNN